MDSTALWEQIQRGESPPLVTPTSHRSSWVELPDDAASGTSGGVDDASVASHRGPAVLPLAVPSDMEMVLRNLRLLGLDRLDDWPHITVETFRLSKDAMARQKSRIAAAEWAFYRLWEVYEPRETRSKLRSYFPALEPRQSTTLRATLVQLLTGLKEKAVLPKECLVRKSSLDECKGDRFEELLFYFSSVVVRKQHLEAQSKLPTSIATQLATAGAQMDDTDSDRLATLGLAFRGATRAQLVHRDATRAKLTALAKSLASKKEMLEARQKRDEEHTLAANSILTESRADPQNLKKQLRDACSLHLDWVNMAISGDNNTDRDAAFEVPFKRLWKSSLSGTPEMNLDSVTLSLPDDLGRRVQDQRDRLENWRNFQASISLKNRELTSLKSPMKTPARPTHGRTPSSARHRRTTSIKSLGSSPPKRRTPSPSKGRPQSITANTRVQSSHNELSSVLEASSPLGARDRQEANIATRRFGGASLQKAVQGESQDLDPVQEQPLPAHDRTGLDGLSAPSDSASKASLGERLAQPASNLPGITRPAHAHALAESMSQLSLAERTMLSMRQAEGAQKKRESFLASLHTRPVEVTYAQTAANHHQPADSLAERTRKSMAGINFPLSAVAPESLGRHKSHRKSRSVTGQFPVNPWEMASPPRQSSAGTLQVGVEADGARPQRSVTPVEQLYEQDVDATSVFKTRSKMRHSPPPL